jgi:RND family efflux transporter MFP subunit
VRPHRYETVPVVIVAGVALVLATGGLMILRSEARTNKIALASSPQPVAVAPATHAMYRASRTYAGTFESWIESSVGPQFLSAYADTVLVRPGAVVKRGDVLATLDCRNANAETQATGMQARAIAAEQKAMANEAARTRTMLDGGFVSPDEAELKTAKSAEREADLAAQQAKLAQASLTASDCVLRAPFDGEVATRSVDPGVFVRPGTNVVTVVDRSTVRLVADAPETDFDILKPGKPVRVRVYATGEEVPGVVSRRSPGTDLATRTVHVEVDVPDPQRQIPTHTTGEVHIDAGEPVPATEVPLYAASIRGDSARLFVVVGEKVQSRTARVLGEIGGRLFLDPSLAEGTPVVLEGRELLEDGDRVAAREGHPTGEDR